MRPEITILASLHLIFMLVSNLPGEISFLKRYHWLTGTSQNWRMFYSAYTFKDQEFTVIANNGVEFQAAPPRYTERIEGGRLPIRLINYLGRLRNPNNEVAERVWIERLAREVGEAGGESFLVKARSLRTRNFYYSRRDGVIYKELVDDLGPYPALK